MANATSTAYHIVCVGPDLPKVNKQYPCHEARDLPPSDFWAFEIRSNDYIEANGPRNCSQ